MVTTMKAAGERESLVTATAWSLQGWHKAKFSTLMGREFLSKHVALKVAHSGHLNIFFFSSPIFTDSIGFHAVASYLTLLTTTINYLQILFVNHML